MTTHRSRACLTSAMVAALLLLVFAANMPPALAETPAERPRIGLVLGGGGARGATHIGVLRELERLRVPIDAIAGTSMGAMVGGLYASGFTARELEDIVTSIDWANELADEALRSDRNFRRKEDDEQFPVNVELGLRDGGVAMPMGLIQGHRLDLLLHELTLKVSDIKDFDQLPIPFRAVASDIETAEAYVMDHGDLAEAIRASMSVPGVLSPAVIDGHVLVDGGIVANLPIDVMRAMDVDVIIAVDAEFPLYAPEELDSALKVSGQVLTILIRRATRQQIETLTEHDILIRPDLGMFASTAFGGIASVIQPGVDATVAVAERLQYLAVDAETYADYSARRKVAPRRELTLAFVRIVQDGTPAEAIVQARVHAKVGDPIVTQQLAADADRLYGLSLYESVSYRLVEENGRTGVEFRAKTKSWGTNDLLFGLSLEEGFEGSTAFNLSARVTRVGLNSFGAEWRSDVQVGSEPVAVSEFYQPLDRGSPWFIAPRIELRRSNLGVFSDASEVEKLRLSKAEVGLDFGRAIGYSGEMRFGVYRGEGKTRTIIGNPARPDTQFDTGGLFAALRFDTRDNAHFPTRGVNAGLRWTGSRPSLGADDAFETIEGDILSTWSQGRNSYQAGFSYATTSGGAGSLQDLFPLGGFRNLSGLTRGAISGPHAALAKLVFYRRMRETASVFEIPIYLGASIEAGNAWQSRADIGPGSVLINASLFAGLDTYLGPLFLAAGFAEGGEKNIYLLIGAPPR